MRFFARRRIIIFAAVFFGMLVFVVRTLMLHTRPKMLPQEATVRRVVDGDSLQLTNNLEIRLLDIDAPELFGERGELALHAKAELQSLVYRRKIRMVAGPETMDKYHRFLAYVFVKKGKATDAPEVFVNAELARRGAARLKAWRSSGDLYERIRDAEAEARAAKRGIWAKQGPAD